MSALLEELKKNSSRWLKNRSEKLSAFAWQRGYSVFSVNNARLHIVVRYIENQHAHHKRNEYKDEMLHFYKRNNVEFDERYVWD